MLPSCLQSTADKLTVSKCGNSFVISDSKQIFLFEHDSDIEKYNLLKKLKNKSNNGAFFDCKRNIIVSPYGYKGVKNNKGGVTIFDLTTNKMRDYEIYDGVNGQLGRYKNGVLLSTMLIHRAKINSEEGYVPPKTVLDKNMIFDNPKRFPQEVVEDYKHGRIWKLFEYMHLFDLDKKRIIKSYKQNADYGRIIEGKIYVELIDAVGIIDLENKFRIKLLERKTEYNNNEVRLSVPANTIGVFVNKEYYLITTDRSWDFATSRNQRVSKKYKNNTIYKIVDEKLIELAVLPFNHIAYSVAVGVDIFMFSNNAKNIAKFNTLTNKITKYKILLPSVSKEYTIDSVGYTKNGFILAMSIKGTTKGLIFLTNKSFSKISAVYAVPMSNISITTNEDIQTTNYRAVN